MEKKLDVKRARYLKSPSVHVVVTKRLIENSITQNSSHCMVSNAVRDALPNAASISTDLQTIRFSLPEKRLRYTYLTPRIAQLALIDFDQGKEPAPFSFVLRKAHITSMYRRNKVATPRSRELTAAQQAALNKAKESNPTHQLHRARVADHPELTHMRLVRGKRGDVAEVIGGKPAPVGGFAKSRQFGLRMLGR